MNTEALLDTLCVRFGFCLDPAEKAEMIGSPPETVDAFTDDVIRREGLDPVRWDSTMRRQMREVVAEAFGEAIWRGRDEIRRTRRTGRFRS